MKESIAISKEERINLARYRAVSRRNPVRTNDFTVYQISFTFEALDLGFLAFFEWFPRDSSKLLPLMLWKMYEFGNLTRNRRAVFIISKLPEYKV